MPKKNTQRRFKRSATKAPISHRKFQRRLSREERMDELIPRRGGGS